MAKLPTPEEMGYVILQEVSFYNTRPNESVVIQGIYSRLYSKNFRKDDIDKGFKYLVEKEYINEKNSFLTEAGFAAMPD